MQIFNGQAICMKLSKKNNIYRRQHYEQFIKLKPYGRFKIILKLYNAKYHFNISDDTFKHYLMDNFNI